MSKSIDLISRAVNGKGLTEKEVVDMVGDKNNWRQIHEDGRCYWAWVGCIIPPYELKQWVKPEEAR